MDRILVLDFGGQYCHLIARRLRALGVRADIAPFSIPAASISRDKTVKGVVLSGGPNSVYEKDAPLPDKALFNLKIPILGICYGHQLLGKFYHANVAGGSKREYGRKTVRIDNTTTLFSGLASNEVVWMSHGDAVQKPPVGFSGTAESPEGILVGMENKNQTRFGLQFHPEVVHTPSGNKILENFIRITKAKREWNAAGQADRLIRALRAQIPKHSHVLMAVSGGVDSTVAALLLHQAIGNRLHAVFIDHGMLRLGEAEQVKAAYERMGLSRSVAFVDASKEFFSALAGVGEPEKKRTIIGHEFVRAFERQAKTINVQLKTKTNSKGKGGKNAEKLEWLAQGTIYPDRIESANASKTAHKIKTHHNLALPKDMTLKVVEPLSDFYKDEVRAIGKELGVPPVILNRHPFPGPGLAVRCLGEVTREKIELVRAADAIFIETLRKHGWYDKTWQAFAALLNVRSVGVQGDARTYGHMIALRAVNAIDGMTADWTKLPPELLEEASTRITNEVRGVNRVVYDVTQKPPATIELE